MKKQILNFIIVCFLVFLSTSTSGFSTHSTTISRSFDKDEAVVGESIVVTVSFVNEDAYELRGFYYAEQIPDGLSVNTISVQIDGSTISNYVVESGTSGDVYPGSVPYRWVLETPTSFAENNPISPGSTIEIVYSISSLQAGAFNFDEFNWVGYYQEALAGMRAAFGHSENVDKQMITFTDSIMRLSEIIGTWSNGIWYCDVAASSWTEMISYASSGDIAAGDFTGDGRADVASIWSDGLWYQDGATLAWTKIDSLPPYRVTAGDVTGDGRFEIIGTWANGIRYWDFVASKWTQMTSESTTGDIAAGDFTGDGKADVASSWGSDGLWYQDGASLAWTKIDSLPPYRVAAGDVTGDGRDEVIGTWANGIWYWNVAASTWTHMTSYATDGDIAAGDFTGDGKADVASIWSDGLWYQDGATLNWTKVDSSLPFSLTAGDVTGN